MYVRNMAQVMGGQIAQAFSAMEQAGVYDLTAGDHKLDASFEIFIRNYKTPYIFINPTGTEYDKLTFAHEFGHFCSDYVSMGSGVGVDVAEIFSQGMEYLSLIHGTADQNLAKLKLLDSLCIYVEQAAYASFEQQVYGLEGDALTVENVEALYQQVCQNYGMAGGFTYLFITHFFTEPMYVISYVVSNDAALQLYQMELERSGAGLACLKESLGTLEPYFLAFLEEAGLESPFADGRIQRVRDTLQGVLNG
jgi:oligoendopeptidase F